MKQVVGVLLYRDGKVLLQHRDDKPWIYAPGMWGTFGGGVEAGETPQEAARREIEEELGLRLDGPLSPVWHGIAANHEWFVFAAPLIVPPEQLTLREGQGMALLSREELDLYPVGPDYGPILAAFFERHSSPRRT